MKKDNIVSVLVQAMELPPMAACLQVRGMIRVMGMGSWMVSGTTRTQEWKDFCNKYGEFVIGPVQPVNGPYTDSEYRKEDARLKEEEAKSPHNPGWQGQQLPPQQPQQTAEELEKE